MTAITEEEIRECLILFLDNAAMRCDSDCISNSRYSVNDVKENHSFLIVEVNIFKKSCVAFPLYSDLKDGPSRFELDSKLKINWPDGSGIPPSYIHTRHSYIIPFATLLRASAIDLSYEGYRRHYGSIEERDIVMLRNKHYSNQNHPHILVPLAAT